MFAILRVPFLIFLLTAAIGGTMAVLAHQQERENHRAILSQWLQDTGFRLSERLTQASTLLAATSAFLTTRQNSDLSRERMARYTQEIVQSDSFKGALSIALIKLFPAAQADQIEEYIQQAYGAHHQLPPPPAGVEQRSAILLFEPYVDQAPLGYDLINDPRHRADLVDSLNRPSPRLLGPSPAWEGLQSDKSLLLALHLATDSPAPNPDFILLALDQAQLFQNLLPLDGLSLVLKVEDVAAPAAPLYEDAGFAEGLDQSSLLVDHHIQVAGRTWRLSAVLMPSAYPWGHWPITMLLVIGSFLMAITSTVAAYGVSATLRHSRALQQAQTQSLQAKDLHLREMSHRLKNVLARVTAIARQSARQSHDKEEFVRTLQERLQAMAKAQDLLTSSIHHSVDLHDLLRIELEQIYGGAMDQISLSGPRVRLNDRQNQPFGLAIHELATNALKYGAASRPDGRIDVSWQIVTSEGDRPYLDLLWHEHFPLGPQTAPPKPSFGSRLIDSSIRSDLSGSLQRDFHPDGLRVRINFPLDPCNSPKTGQPAALGPPLLPKAS